MTIDQHTPLTDMKESATAVPAWWASQHAQIETFLDTSVTAGHVELLTDSAGGRPVRAARNAKRLAIAGNRVRRPGSVRVADASEGTALLPWISRIR